MSSIRLVVIGIFCFVAATAMAAGPGNLSGYRLSGTINSSNSNWLALVEAPGGDQQLVRIGDQLAGASVIDISDNTIRLAIGEQAWILNLEGLIDDGPLVVSQLPVGLKPTAAIRAEVASLVAKTHAQRQAASATGVSGAEPSAPTPAVAATGESVPDSVSVGGAGGLMGSIQGRSSGTGPITRTGSGTSQNFQGTSNNGAGSTTPAASAPTTTTDPGKVEPGPAAPADPGPAIQAELQKILNLPPEATIVTIDHRPVTMTEQTLLLLNRSLQNGQQTGAPVRIGVAGVPDISALYLMPEEG